MAKRKRVRAKPKPRRTWTINPKTRVKPSGKIYHRAKVKKISRGWVKKIDWFGERE